MALYGSKIRVRRTTPLITGRCRPALRTSHSWDRGQTSARQTAEGEQRRCGTSDLCAEDRVVGVPMASPMTPNTRHPKAWLSKLSAALTCITHLLLIWRSTSSIRRPSLIRRSLRTTDLVNAKRNGKTIAAKPRPRSENAVDIMDALKKSIAGEASTKGKKPRKASAGQKEMLLPIEGKKPAGKNFPNRSDLQREKQVQRLV